MAKAWLGRGVWGTGYAMASLLTGCYSASVDEAAKAPVASNGEQIIAGFSANDAALNAVGAIAIREGGSIYPICTATLVADNMALTAKHCVDVFDWGVGSDAKIVFAIGPNAYGPAAEVEIVDYERAPVDSGGYTGYGHDVAVLHFGERVTDVAMMGWAPLDDTAIGKAFVGIGYGEQDRTGTSGTRKLGTVTLRQRLGRTYEFLYGSFAAFFEWQMGQPLPDYCLDDADGGAPLPPVVDAGFPEPPGSGGRGGTAGKGGSGGSGGGGADDYLCQYAYYLLEQYNGERLETLAEVAVGGAPGDSQPCYGDSGGPLLRKNSAGKLTVYGVVNGGRGSSRIQCDNGAIYASFDKTVLDFFEQAKKWVDPCENISTVGHCVGTRAERCTTRNEGKRRQVAFDCATVDLTCQAQSDGSIGCGSDGTYFKPAPKYTPAHPIDLETLGKKVFKQPGAAKP